LGERRELNVNLGFHVQAGRDELKNIRVFNWKGLLLGAYKKMRKWTRKKDPVGAWHKREKKKSFGARPL